MAFTYKGQQMRKWVPLALIGGVVLTIILALVAVAKARPVPREYYAEKPITQTVPGASGTPTTVVVKQQPDHGWFYYYMMYSLLNQQVQPTYHVPAPRVTYTAPASYGGSSSPSHVSRPSSSWPSTTSTPYRSGGGFSSSPAPARSSGSYRSSGGFSSRPSSPSRPSSSRSSGGFSKRQ